MKILTFAYLRIYLLMSVVLVYADLSLAQNPIVTENTLPGNPTSEWDIDGAGDLSIQGFATEISINKGETVHFKINTDATDYTVKIYRLGYYQGNGARFIANATITAVLPQLQPPAFYDPATGLTDCGTWNESAHWDVPSTAVSGIYLARLTRTDNSGASHIVFIVRDDASTSDLYFQTSDATWQAYNVYGGNSLYTGSTSYASGHATKVSYNRPFVTRNGGGGGGAAEDWLFNAEYPMVRWLERNGFDVSYTTCVDADRIGSLILQHKVFLSVGHDEYWSAQQRSNVENARNAGIHLAFFSGNEIYWKTRWENSMDGSSTPYRTLVCYKEGNLGENICGDKCDPLPDTWTGLWRNGCEYTLADGCRPENALSGQISWDDTQGAITVPSAYKNLRFWRNTPIASMATGETATLSDGTLGYEWDFEQYAEHYPAGRIRLSETYLNTHTHHLSLYRHNSGALVFGAGTVQWSWGLDGNHDRGVSEEDPRMQQATINLLADMGVQPASIQSGLAAASSSTDITPPVSSITSPSNGVVLTNGLPLTITGTASDNVLVAGVEVSTNGGISWNMATGTNTWSYTFIPGIGGTITFLSRAFDDSGNMEVPAPGITDTVSAAAPFDCPCHIFLPSDAPVVEIANDGQAIELGVKFQSAQPGYITGLRYYKGTGTTGIHTGHLWSNTGELLAEATYTSETASGWQEVGLSNPVAIFANTTYIVSFFSSSGDYPYTENYFGSAILHGPLRALANGEEGPNGVYKYGGEPAFPTNSYNASNYWADVVFADSVGIDTIPPVVASTIPAASATGININTSVTVNFSEQIDLSTLNASTVFLRDAASVVVPCVLSYHDFTHKATLVPTLPLNYSTIYTLTVKGGTGYERIKDQQGNAMTGDYTCSFTTAPVPPPFPAEGHGGPVLLISNSTNPFSRYPVEILRAEGFNAFMALDITAVDASVLNIYEVVILGEMTLTPAQVTMFTNWTNAGGTFIALRPDAQLSGLLGLTATGSTLSDKYLLVQAGSGPGTGIVNQTIQYHGTADLYTLSGATAVATLYSNATTATTYPAVSLRNVGTNGGQAIAFTYDLAKSVVYTRQGNPAWAAQKRDGQSGPIRSDDQFYPDWIDLNKVAIPQADEQQHLLSNLMITGNLDHKPLPRFWFLPKGLKAAVVMTGDNHGDGGMKPRFDLDITTSTAGCSVNDWECIRSTGYLYPGSTFTDSMAAYYNSIGFEVALHVNTDCSNSSASQYNTYVTDQLSTFQAAFPSVPSPSTNRNHCIAWSDWSSVPETESANGIRFDVNYYYWPESWVANRPGMFTGSGIPMRFAKTDGSIIDCYQAPTQMPDESGEIFPGFCDALLDKAIGTEGYYGVFVTNMHFDQTNHPGANAIVASAKARNIPVVSAKQMLDWLDGRNGSYFSAMNWSGNELSFTVTADSKAHNLKAMLPYQVNGSNLISITNGGSPVTFTHEVIKGIEYAFFPSTTGNYVATYSLTPVLEITGINAVPHADGTASITWTTNIATDSRVDYDSVSTPLSHNTNNAALVTSHSITLGGLTAGQTYYYRVTSADGSLSVTSPDPASAPLNFTMPLSYCAQDETTSDFSAGTLSGASIVNLQDGEITLQPLQYQEFSGAAIPSGWGEAIWDGQAGAVTTYSGNAVLVNGTHVYTNSVFDASSAIEFSATFSTGNFQNVGYTGDTAFNDPWVTIGRGAASDGNVYARASSGESVSIGSGLLDQPHVYRIERNTATGSFSFYVDGTLVPTPGITLTTTAGMVVQVSDYPAGGPALQLDWMKILPYDTTGEYTSHIFDHGDSTNWETVSWNDSIPDGTSLVILARGGNTPTPDTSWTAFQPMVNGASAGISSRYLQYKAQLHTIHPTLSPVLEDIHISCSSVVVPCTPPVAYISAVDAVVCEGHPVQIRLDSAGGPSPYTIVVNGNTYTGITAGQIFAGFQPVNKSLWGSTGTPVNPDGNDGLPIETGVKFRTSENGLVKGVRFYKGVSNTGTHTGSLWTANGTLLATAVFSSETTSGWQEVEFATPVQVFADTTYIASYYSPGGGFAISPAYFTTTGYTNAPLTALQSGIDGPNGVYAYGGGFPSNGNNANYWVDVLFMEKQNDTTLTYVMTSITNNSGCANTGDSIAVATAQIASLPAGNITASPVCPGQDIYLTFHATSGTGPFDLTINDSTYSHISSGTAFNTGFQLSSMIAQSIWNNAVVPATASVTDNASIELGLRFRSDIAGKITGVRFYKGPSNTGAHTGSLWSNTGTLLATATFTSETVTGWQEVLFSSPVNISANTTYIVSYHTTSGNYAFDPAYFTSSGTDNGYLHALQDNVDGRNGVYKYGSSTVFPTETYNAGNYWVDVLFTESDNSFTLTKVSDINGCSTIIPSKKVVPAATTALTASVVSHTNVSCKSGSNGTAVVTASGGSGTYHYLWNDVLSQANDTATGLTAGNYEAIVIDAGGCHDTLVLAVTITEPALSLTASLSKTDAHCYNGNDGWAVATVSGGITPYAFQWSNASVNDTINNLAAGNYSVLVTDASNCTISDTLTILQPALSDTVRFVDLCNGQTLVTGTHLYTTSGIYTDTLTTSTGCDSIVVTHLNILPALTAIQNLSVCPGASVHVGIHTYNVSGTYEDTLTAANGCDSLVTTHLVVLPTITHNQNINLCYGESIMVGSHSYNLTGTYSDTLTAHNGCDSIVGTNLVVLPVISHTQDVQLCYGESISVGSHVYNATGTYADTLIAASGCDSTVITHLTVQPFAGYSQNITLCAGNSITVGTHSYSVSGIYVDTLTTGTGCDSVITTDLTVMNAITGNVYALICENDSLYAGGNWQHTSGIYYDTLTAVNGCDSLLITGLTVNPGFLTEQAAHICHGDSIQIAGIYQHLPGIYTDTLISQAGCDSIISTMLTVITVDTSVMVMADSLRANATGTDFQWMNCTTGDSIPGATGASFVPLYSGIYSVIVNEFGCRDTSACFMINLTGIKEQEELSVTVYPNPVSQMLTISISGNREGMVRCRLTDLLGETVMDQMHTTSTVQLDMQYLPAGPYFLNLDHNNKHSVIKVIKN